MYKISHSEIGKKKTIIEFVGYKYNISLKNNNGYNMIS